MVTIVDLQIALERLYANSPPKKALKLSVIREVVACYLCINIEQIQEADLQTSLRNLDFALPKPKLRTKPGEKPVIDWYFVKKMEPKALKSVSSKKRKYKNKSLVDSFKMVAS